ncbi:alpha/beta fold hydrolase domain-containing protein [Halopseudomonas salegens]|uniref:Pimeloyl-ACP methyl ester carboxylesterase n=1 Tax=Halopseudomonas salegens TaxID=1434072 RepID=A0A1H2HIP5_9GAMM|nr:alpha/beta hydrolase [Halopseudomonas salegens]SDU31760.1 hypothetical protein SAMN05216210_3074 [Halopseudomonas salegens]
MKLVLLPGMDGTGVLFEPLLNQLDDVNIEVLLLPDKGPQDYLFLAEYVASRLPEQEHIILAESFSGGIVEALLNKDPANLKGVIFAASFLSSPSRVLSRLAALLPIKLLVAVPVLAPCILRAFLLGKGASPEMVALFRAAIAQVPSEVLRSRLRQIATYRASNSVFDIESLYLCPEGDVLVRNKEHELKKAFPGMQVVKLAGPHFILQASPEACAGYIRDMLVHLTSTGTGAPPAPAL